MTIKTEDIIQRTNGNVIAIDNFYSEKEVADIMQELNMLVKENKLKPPEATKSATNAEGQLQKQNKSLFLNSAHADGSLSDILRINRKLFSVNVSGGAPVFKALQFCNTDGTLISYYEDSDFYNPHVDATVLTALTYFFDEPKKFSGGDLYLPEYDLTLECVRNRVYIFCGLIEHQALQVSMDEEHKGKGLGRFCMAQFLNFKE